MIRIGIDVGGTGIQFGAVDKNLKILAENSIPTTTSVSFSEQVARIAETVVSTAAAAGYAPEQIESIGVGISSRYRYTLIPFAANTHAAVLAKRSDLIRLSYATAILPASGFGPSPMFSRRC